MIRNFITYTFIALAFTITVQKINAQEKVVIDEIVAVIGNSAVLESELIAEKNQFAAQGVDLGENPLCALLNDIIYQKLLYNQAVIDSVEVSPMQVEQEMERRLRFFIQQIGSRERLEAYYGMSIEEIKDDFRDMVKEQILSQMMEQKIGQDIRVSPSEVREFFNKLPEDSIPIVDMELQLAHIVIEPPVREEEIERIKTNLNEYRDRVLRGERFNTLAILYSDDAGSARRGGELGFYTRGELFPEFEAVAFGLKPGEVSEIVETPAGYHIIQMIERRGEQINVRHILMQPQVMPEDMLKVRSELDSIRNLINTEQMTFAEAAEKFSDDPTKANRGLMINPFTGTTRFKSDELESRLFMAVDKMEIGEVSEPMPMQTEDGQQALRIVKLVNRIEPHKATLSGDYDFVQNLVLNHKRRKAVQAWIEEKLPSTYIFIHPKYHECKFDINWLKE